MVAPAPLPPFPSGWYAVDRADALAPGALLTRTFFGREVVVFRTASGAVHAVEAWCPHLGAHLGKGGTVQGETLECPFHGFRFDGGGRCVRAYAGQEGTIKRGLETLPVLERNGWLMVWGDVAGAAPWFEPPPVDPAGWTALEVRSWRLRSHPQETTENSVDTGHFGSVHGYSDVTVHAPLRVEGAFAEATYGMARPNPYSALLPAIRTRFHVQVWGLGYSQVDIEVLNYGFRLRLFVLAQPVDGDEIELRVGVQMRDVGDAPSWLPDWVPTLWLTRLLNRSSAAEIARDVSDDFEIWTNKITVHPPALARGDGPIGRYRAYAQQFYASSDRDRDRDHQAAC